MRPSHVSELLDSIIKAPINEGKRKPTVLLLGSPGCGKTSVVRQAAKRNKLFLVERHPLFDEPIDWTGVPDVVRNGAPENSRTWWAAPNWVLDEVPEGYDGIMVLVDEATQCDPPMMKAEAPLFEEHRVGSQHFPDGTVVVATGNRAGQRAGAIKLLSHVQSRIVDVDFDSSLEDFIEWGTTHGILPQIRYFLAFKPECLNTFGPAVEGSYASQRGWEKVSDLYEIVPEHLQMETIAGTVGKGPAAEFLAFTRVWEQLSATFDVAKILANPEKAPLPKKDQVDVLYALVGSIAEKAKAAPGIELIIKALTYFNRLPKEFGFLGVQNTSNHAGTERFRLIYQHPAYLKWFKENQELLNEARQK